jgi:hypothetical protein
MISLIHYISATRRLKESEKTVIMMGGEEECPEMLRAQRDMIQLEKEYYLEEVMKLSFRVVYLTPIIFGIFYFLSN